MAQLLSSWFFLLKETRWWCTSSTDLQRCRWMRWVCLHSPAVLMSIGRCKWHHVTPEQGRLPFCDVTAHVIGPIWRPSANHSHEE
ncbi:hypothetical protein E2C01_022775 [Portunus trituberculatus]|uniref:Secreted protein n=1 Tax=Portunus trituberculatus TaxID=210409 RepID=A0A5B7E860_PORTR|nr:hypothetical protein [Portunus trituberculatus]